VKKASKTSLVITVFVIAAAIVFVGFVGIQAQVKIQVKPDNPGKPPKPEEPIPPLSLADHNLVMGDACGDLWVMRQSEPYNYVEAWKGGSPDVDSYYSLQLVDVTGDDIPDLVAAGVIMGGRKDDFASKTVLEVWSPLLEEGQSNPVFRAEIFNDILEWHARVEVGDVDGDYIQDIVLKTHKQVDIFSAGDFEHWWTYEAGSDFMFSGLALGNLITDVGREVIVGVREYDGSSYRGFLRVFEVRGTEDYTVKDFDWTASHDEGIVCYYLEDFRTYDLDGDGTLEIFSTSQAHDYNYPVRRRAYSYFTHLHVWEWDWQDAKYVPLTEFRVDNLHQYLSIASFDVGKLDDGTIAVVLGTHGGDNSTLTVLGWEEGVLEEGVFNELIHGPTPVVTGGTGGEIWAVTLDDIDGDDYDEIILSGNAGGEKFYVAYVEMFDWTEGGLLSLWNKIDQACVWVRTHITN
jgi:hypothetical protein